ncbi:sulfatase-like hydrolase/transferase [bacterium SCSIO 12741]|nr:sulfatase-like hydrolase/transferase [bacterium SCSIO 12741]
MSLPKFYWKRIAAVAMLPLLVACSAPERSTMNPTAETPYPPNIIFILIDDLGSISTPYYQDFKSGNSSWVYDENGDSADYKTPHLDRLADHGTVFTRMYATPYCAPSRGQLMTGRYPFQTGIVYPGYTACQPANLQSRLYGYLSDTISTYANVLKDYGYQTAFGGKWNLRFGRENACFDHSTNYTNLVSVQKEHLNTHGFDSTYGPNALLGAMVDYYPPQMGGRYFPDQLNQWAIQKINQLDSSKPFYLHYCMGLIHEELDSLCVDAPTPDGPHQSKAAIFASKMAYADSLIGEVIKTLEQKGILENTLLIVAGDNGTENDYFSKYRGMIVRGGKGTTFDHGSRVPFIVHWPEQIKKKSLDTDLADFADVFPTMAQLCETYDSSLAPVSLSGIQGTSLLGRMTQGNLGGKDSIRKFVYCQFNTTAFIANEKFQWIINYRDSIGDPRPSDTTFYQIYGPGVQRIPTNPNDHPEVADAFLAYYNQLNPDLTNGLAWSSRKRQMFTLEDSIPKCYENGCTHFSRCEN